MKLTLENIGMLKHAEITLHRLCVIAGENDNGKSTVGKIVFCIVKAINRYKEDLQESKEFALREKTDNIYMLLRRSVQSAEVEGMDMLRSLRSIAKSGVELSEQIDVIDRAIVSVTGRNDVDFDLVSEVRHLRSEIDHILNQPENINQSIENAFNKVFASEFDASLLLHGAAEGSIQLADNNIPLIHLSVTPNGVYLKGEVEPIALKEATFIDSPLILNNHDLLARSQTLLDIDQRRSGRVGLPYTTLHTKDLFNKLCTPVLPFDLFTETHADLLADIQALVNGEVAYDKNERDFVFRRHGEVVSIKNTASGIKVFGLLQILVANDFVAKNTILIFDEPENHLHPKWQLKLAEVLLKLVEKGVYVLVSSHNPYLIEALKRGIDRAEFTRQSRFAFAKNQRITDQDRLSEIFEVLAEPFEQFRQMDAEDLRDE